MPNKTTLHLPIEQTTLEKLRVRAYDLGFSSAQSYIRYWATCEATHRSSQKLSLSPVQAQAVRYIELAATQVPGHCYTVEQVLNYIANYIRESTGYSHLKRVGLDVSLHDDPGKI